MISELSQLVAMLEQLNNRMDKKIVTAQEIKEANNSILELHQDLELLMETIQNALNPETPIPNTFAHLNRRFVDVMSDMYSMQELVSFALNRYRGLKKLKLKQ